MGETKPELLQFINCRILRDHKIIKEDFWVRSGVIVNPEKIFFDEKIEASRKIDCGGHIIAPGFIDLQINGCSLEYALEAASLHPAKALGIENVKGTLNFGADADFIIFDDDLQLKSTWIAGECVYKK
ncbi:N-acetylglucosamine-6-phosphate deacetylase [Asbolus verrucosus]|uniref:N-acetylglucosamine-6-phosphate deacetylase n=1 Tax=Asbolus verrucosus TaxID=1661398 RepID=A0A482V9W6_ASBVE|nr:N-acetylglucosamine-6-phosphate deacetylase [Asbolus verrucosus]